MGFGLRLERGLSHLLIEIQPFLGEEAWIQKLKDALSGSLATFEGCVFRGLAFLQSHHQGIGIVGVDQDGVGPAEFCHGSVLRGYDGATGKQGFRHGQSKSFGYRGVHQGRRSLVPRP